ncbi:MAG: metallophosphoesterase family protein [Verrucomicrobia bacterium]|nr:metallophosphoesterase family protein [Verrucomicrobiota bacterium]
MTCRLIHIPPKPTKLGSCDLLLHGHTHVPREEMIAGVRVLNPGTIGKANNGGSAELCLAGISRRQGSRVAH